MGKHVGTKYLGWAVSTGAKPEREQSANASVSNIAPSTVFLSIYDGYEGEDGDGDHTAIYLDQQGAIALRGLLDDIVGELGGATIYDMAADAYGRGRDGESKRLRTRVERALL
jgi:hypothetical protein